MGENRLMFRVPEKYRVTVGPMGSDSSHGNNGYFLIKSLKIKKPLNVIVSDGMNWEHVSVSTPTRCPTWEEMCFVKSLFWDKDDVVMQLHPAESDYVNVHEYCLHLWRPINQAIPLPPSIMVGPKALNKDKK